jgi:adenylate cyclase
MTKEGLATAIDLLDRAVALSPSYSEALAYEAWCRALRPLHGFSPNPARDFREASDLAKRALSSDPDDALAFRCAGITVVFVDRDYQSGWDLMERSLGVNPNAALTWGLCGWISMWAGHPERAITEFKKAIRLSPFDQWISNYSNGMAFSLNTSGQFEEGLWWARKCMQENPLWVASHRQLIARECGQIPDPRPELPSLHMSGKCSVAAHFEPGASVCSAG